MLTVFKKPRQRLTNTQSIQPQAKSQTTVETAFFQPVRSIQQDVHLKQSLEFVQSFFVVSVGTPLLFEDTLCSQLQR